MEFDFKIHWKQLAPSLPSPILFHLPLAFTACVRLLFSLTSGAPAAALHNWDQELVSKLLQIKHHLITAELKNNNEQNKKKACL